MATAAWITWAVDAPDRPFLTAGEIAGLFGYESEDSVRNMVKAGQLRAPVQRGGKQVWTREDVILSALLIKFGERLVAAEPGRREAKPAES